MSFDVPARRFGQMVPKKDLFYIEIRKAIIVKKRLANHLFSGNSKSSWK